MGKRREEEIVAKVRRFVADAREAQSEWRETAEECLRFYRGQQWRDEDVEMLRQQGRPALTINHVLPIINQLSGVQRQYRKDFKVMPRRRGTDTVASVYTALVKHASDQSGYDYQAADQFLNGLITGQGWLWVRPDYSRDWEHGDLRITHEPAHMVFPDPSSRSFNLNEDGSHVVLGRWELKDQIEGEVPESRHAELSEASAQPDTDISADLVRFIVGGGADEDERAEHFRRYRYLVWHAYWREPVRRAELRDTVLGESRSLVGKTRIAKVRRQIEEWHGRFEIVGERTCRRLVYAKICGGVMLEHKEEPFGEEIDALPLIRFGPMWDEQTGETFGMVENLRGPQEEENKRRSQVLHHLNQSANSGWTVPRNAVTPDEKENIENFGSMPGIVITYDAAIGEPKRISPMPMSAGHDHLSRLAANDMREISGVNTESLGYQAKSGTSGRALELQQRQGQTTTEICFDHFDAAQQEVGDLMLQLISRLGLYSEEEISALIDDEDLYDRKLLSRAAEDVGPPPQPPPPLPEQANALRPEDAVSLVHVHQEAVSRFEQAAAAYDEAVKLRAKELMLEKLRDADIADYGCRVAQASTSPTVRAAQFAELVELARLAPIPPDVLIAATDRPDKEELIDRMQQAAAQAQGMPQQQMQGMPQQPIQAGQETR